MRFEWDELKDRVNRSKHGVDFSVARRAFEDPHRLILRDSLHSATEARFFCLGRVDDKILTVRFTLRGEVIRLIGAGYWRKFARIYHQENHS